VAETVTLLRSAGIRTVILTGDQGPTAVAVARAVGMEPTEDQVVDGRDLVEGEGDDLPRLVAGADVFSRMGPEEKLRVVEALREAGEIVAMLGDGVNDAAALKRADVGVAMGVRGTDVARETADVVLQDDRFPTVAAAVEEGRVIFDNIRKFVYYLFGCNVAEILVVLAATGAGLPLPLLPLQILWLNLVTDTFPALALAVEPGEPDVMRRPPRDPDSGILSRRFVASLLLFALLITAVTLGAYLWALRDGNVERAVTIAFMTLALAQLFHLGNARSRDRVLRPGRALANPWALGAVGLVLALQLLAVYWPPLAGLLETVPLSPGDWGVVLLAASVPAVVGQALPRTSAPM
jgi:Ca2+-transporting ATPase